MIRISGSHFRLTVDQNLPRIPNLTAKVGEILSTVFHSCFVSLGSLQNFNYIYIGINIHIYIIGNVSSPVGIKWLTDSVRQW